MYKDAIDKTPLSEKVEEIQNKNVKIKEERD